MARENENVNGQGSRDLNLTFMAFKRTESSSPDWPPDKNAIPGTAAGTVRKRHLTVDLVNLFLLGACQSGKHHVGLQNHALQHHPLCMYSTVDLSHI